MSGGAGRPPRSPDTGACADGSAPQSLRKRRDFLAAATGRRFHTERMTAQTRLRGADEMRDGTRAAGLYVGLTVTKRVGHATERNRIKRRLRRAVAIACGTVPPAQADIVLVARRPALDAPFAILIDDLRRALGVLTRPRRPLPPSAARSEPAAPGETPRAGAHVIPPDEAGERLRREISRTKAPRGTTDG